MSFSLNLRGPFVWRSEEERKKGKEEEEEGGGFEEMTSEGDRREMKAVETDRKREGGMKKTHREGWG